MSNLLYENNLLYGWGKRMEQKSSPTNYKKKTEKTDKHLSVITQQINGDYFCNQKKQIN